MNWEIFAGALTYCTLIASALLAIFGYIDDKPKAYRLSLVIVCVLCISVVAGMGWYPV